MSTNILLTRALLMNGATISYKGGYFMRASDNAGDVITGAPDGREGRWSLTDNGVAAAHDQLVRFAREDGCDLDGDPLPDPAGRPENGTRVRLVKTRGPGASGALNGVTGVVVDPIAGLPGGHADYVCGLLIDAECARGRNLSTHLHPSGKAAINIHHGDTFEVIAPTNDLVPTGLRR